MELSKGIVKISCIPPCKVVFYIFLIPPSTSPDFCYNSGIKYICFMKHKTKSRPKHLGRKIGRMREVLGIKQEVVADKLGISQQAVSKIEQSDNVDNVMLERMAEALGVNPEAIKNFNEEATINYIQQNYEGSNQDASNVFGSHNQFTYNPLDKLMEALAENKKLYEELLKSEREKVALLQKLLDEK